MAVVEQHAGELVWVKWGDCVPTKDNRREWPKGGPRKSAKIQELATSIRRHGILEPLLGRPHPEETGKIEIRAGFCRHFAAALEGLEQVPVFVRDMTDDEAFAVTFEENARRSDLTPIEEGMQVALALEKGWTLEQTANEIGHSPKWVARRAQLAKLSKRWREAYANPKCGVSRWSAAHLELVARFPEDVQDRFLEDEGWDIDGRWTAYSVSNLDVADVRRALAHSLNALELAPWDLDDEALYPEAGACVACPHRSDATPELWEPDEDFGRTGKAGRGARCLSPACWGEKQKRHVALAVEEAKATHGKVLELRDVDRYGAGVKEYKRPGAGRKPAVWVEGPKAGTVTYVKPETSATQRTARSKPKTVQEKKDHYDRLRLRAVIDKVKEACEELLHGDGMLPEGLDSDEVTALAAVFGTFDTGFPESITWRYDEREEDDDAWSEVARMRGASDAVIRTLFRQVCGVLAERLKSEGWRLAAQNSGLPVLEETPRVCELIGLDLGQLEEEAAAAKPYPKSWGLDADGNVPPQAPAKANGRKRGRPKGSKDSKPRKKKAAAKRKRKGPGAAK